MDKEREAYIKAYNAYSASDKTVEDAAAYVEAVNAYMEPEKTFRAKLNALEVAYKS